MLHVRDCAISILLDSRKNVMHGACCLLYHIPICHMVVRLVTQVSTIWSKDMVYHWQVILNTIDLWFNLFSCFIYKRYPDASCLYHTVVKSQQLFWRILSGGELHCIYGKCYWDYHLRSSDSVSSRCLRMERCYDDFGKYFLASHDMRCGVENIERWRHWI